VSALIVRRRIRNLPELPLAEALGFARDLTWYGDKLRPTQATDEILWLLDQLADLRPVTVVEIGVEHGGTLFLWSRVAAPDALLVAVDMRPLGKLGRRSAYALVRRALARPRQRIELVMPADSHDPATIERVERLLEGKAVDFLFIDGDHSYEGVKRDYELWLPLVRSGGLVAFHDVGPEVPEVARFWGELKQTVATEERLSGTEMVYGIGLVHVP
jgi:cephalosporin hydroxylase